MEISFKLQFIPRGAASAHIVKKTTLILMHRLATCQDRVSCILSGVVLKTRRLWCAPRLCFNCESTNFFISKSSQHIFLPYPREIFCVLGGKTQRGQRDQSVSVISKQQREWARPHFVWINSPPLFKDLVCASAHEGKTAEWCENHLHLRIITKEFQTDPNIQDWHQPTTAAASFHSFSKSPLFSSPPAANGEWTATASNTKLKLLLEQSLSWFVTKRMTFKGLEKLLMCLCPNEVNEYSFDFQHSLKAFFFVWLCALSKSDEGRVNVSYFSTLHSRCNIVITYL